MVIGSLLGGLQSSRNPGVNMTPGVKTFRRSRLGIPLRATRPIPAGARPAVAPRLGVRFNPLGPGGLKAGHPIGGAAGMGVPPLGPGGMTAGTPVPRPLPTPPVTTPPVAPPGSVPLLTFDQWLATQPLWVQQQATNVAAGNSLMSGYGFYKDASGNLVADPNASPDSVIAQEDLQRQRGISRTAQTGANRGNLFSGASLIGVQNADDAYRQGAARALRDLTEKTGAITQSELDTKIGLGGAYTDYVGATNATNTTAKTTATTKTATAKALADEKDRQARIKRAQDHLKADKAKAKRRKRKNRNPPPRGSGLAVGTATGQSIDFGGG